MPTYITLLRYTPQGLKNFKESPARTDAVRQTFRSMGGDLKSFYLLVGHYDGLAIIEAPDDETYAKMILTVGSDGNVSTETLKAFTEDEYRKIAAGL